jgi:outer membrane protein assembly factor BamB
MREGIRSLYKMRWRSIALCIALASPPTAAQGGAEGWLLRGGDTRRTGRAHVNGPQRGEIAWTYRAKGGVAINMEPTVTRDHVFFGTWGMIRKYGTAPSSWDRFDGAIHGLERRTGRPLWEPVQPGVTAYAYSYSGRALTRRDRSVGEGAHLSFYNGTVEGTAAVDASDGTLYFGRGDGNLYALDAEAGSVKWKFRTRDPLRSDDPESGGQIVGGPLVTPGGCVVFATYGGPVVPDPPALVRSETNAVYCVDRSGAPRWRQPETGTLANPFLAPPALSVSGDRVYAMTQRIDTRHPAHLLALDAETGSAIWQMVFDDRGGQDLAVGSDGLIYVAGLVEADFGRKPAAFAIRDHGDRGETVWTTAFLQKRPQALWAGGVALYEEGAAVLDVYVSTTHSRGANARGGRLHRLDPASGALGASFEPLAADPRGSGGLTDVTLADDGALYVGTRGYRGGLLSRTVAARMYALRPDAGNFRVLWSIVVEGGIDWASPAIGPDGGLYFGSTAPLGDLDPLEPRPAGAAVPGADAVFYAVRDAD